MLLSHALGNVKKNLNKHQSFCSNLFVLVLQLQLFMVQKHILREIQIGVLPNIELKVKTQSLQVHVYPKDRETSLILRVNECITLSEAKLPV